MVKIVREFRVCTDCAMMYCYGECQDSNGECQDNPDREPWNLMPNNEVAMSDTGPEFSWQACEACGSTLAGDRYEFVEFDA